MQRIFFLSPSLAMHHYPLQLMHITSPVCFLFFASLSLQLLSGLYSHSIHLLRIKSSPHTKPMFFIYVFYFLHSASMCVVASLMCSFFSIFSFIIASLSKARASWGMSFTYSWWPSHQIFMILFKLKNAQYDFEKCSLPFSRGEIIVCTDS